jgi:ABC-type lipoprotein release transport system permease subunit
MSVIGILFSEAWQRRGSFLLSLLTVSLAVALFIALLTLNAALQKATTKQMKELGFNLVILPVEVSDQDYAGCRYGEHSMPQEYVHKLAGKRDITADHFSGKLEKKVVWENFDATLTGIMGTLARGQKRPLGFQKPPEVGNAYFGNAVARGVEVAKGPDGKPLKDDKGRFKLVPVTVEGETFRVEKRLAARETKDNYRIYVNLKDAQRMLARPGRIHAIEALGCRCEGDIVAVITSEVEGLLNAGAAEKDKVKVLIPNPPKFYTREKMRAKVEGYAGLVVPLVLLVSVMWIGALSYMNVRQRREEIGLLRAVGVGSRPIAVLFLGKAALTGLVGAALGFAVGHAIAKHYGPGMFELPAKMLKPMWDYLIWSLVASPVLAMMASALPAMVAVSIDPADALREE